jgi:hypothetical protein
MNKPNLKVYLYRMLLMSLVILWGVQTYAGQDGVMDKIKKANTKPKGELINDSPLPVQKDITMVKIKYKGGTFYTETRKDKVERYKCSECHNNKEVAISNAAEIAHGDIKLNHGKMNEELSCLTCHEKDDRNSLSTKEKEKVDMDHAYLMCGQCHFRQKKDWVGGSHGKRVTYWAGKRVVKNCTSCHDPHSPRFNKRWPETYSAPLTK